MTTAVLHTKLIAVAVIAAGCTFSFSCEAQTGQRWTCVYPSYDNREPITVHYSLEGQELRQLDFAISYQVVFDDGRALIAIYPAVGPTNGKYAINARTLVIDRKTGDMLVANTDIGGNDAENAPVKGHCGRSQP